MNEKINQNQMILDFLKTHINGITPQDAVNRFGCYRLSARIHDLREMGYEIESKSETKKNRYGNNCTYARYILKGE